MTLRTLGLSVLGAASLLTLSACQKEEAPVPAPEARPTAGGQPAIRAPEEKKEHAASPIQQPEAAAPAAPAGNGVVKGTVSFTGTAPVAADLPASNDPACQGMAAKDVAVQVKGGKLANVVVRVLGTVQGAPAAPSTPVVVDQTKCTFLPRVQGAVAGQQVVFKNNDGTVHNVRGVTGTKSLFNVAQPPSGAPVQKALPADADVLRLKCDIHPWMTAFVVTSPHPYFATTSEDGTFTLQGLPAGTYTLEAWHETLGKKTSQVEVKEGTPVAVAFTFSDKDGAQTK